MDLQDYVGSRPRAWHVTVVAMLAASLAPIPANAKFDKPDYISNSGQNAVEPQPGVDANGNAVIVWRRFDGTGPVVQARTRSKGGTLGPIRNLSDDQTFYMPRVAVDPSGNAVFIWVHSDGTNRRAQGRTLSAAGVLGPVLDLSDPGGDVAQPDVAIDPNGNAAFVWARPNAQTRRLSKGVLGAIHDVSDPGLGGVGTPQVGFDGGGNAVFAWSDASLVIKARTLSASGKFGAVRTLSKSGSQFPAVAVDANGDAAFVWNAFDGATNFPQGRTLSAAGMLGPLKTLASSGEEGQVGIDAGGNALFTWVQTDTTSGLDRIWTRTYSSGGVVGKAKPVSPNTYNADIPGLALDPAGDAVLSWVVKTGGSHNIAARTRSNTGALGGIQNVSKSSPLNTSAAPAIGGNVKGDVTVVWLGVDDGGLSRVQGSAGP